MDFLKDVLLQFLRWSGWFATACFFYYLKLCWQEGTKREFFSIIGCGIGGLLISASLLVFFFQYARVSSLALAITVMIWIGNMIWVGGTLFCMITVEKGVEFVDFYHEWRDSLNGPSD